MLRLTVLTCTLLLCHFAFAKTIIVKNEDELKAANKSAKPGDTIILQNGIWKNILIKLNCSGTAQEPIVFKAETRGRVIISGVSQLRLGGNYIVVDGLLFENGYSPSSAVIDYRINDNELANNCRVTNCVINDFNKLKRMSEDYWVSFSGKNNRLDHCSFFNKKNLGVLLAVILDSDKSRENFHSIDHNYFGVRPPLGSNGGEIIRVGVSEHCQFNSNTQIRDNFFEYCDGETEVVSIKSGSNVISGNVFKECQGSVVLRHGNYNTVTNNLFLGNGKEATGGVRIINKGQWVINNFFYKCRGESFRSPLAIMNGIPNSPANRYVQVTDAVVMNNSFVDCSPISLAEGSDAERSLPPSNVLFAKNIFYNDKPTAVYNAWDKIDGIHFVDNKISKQYEQDVNPGFERTVFTTQKNDVMILPLAAKETNRLGVDSLKQINKDRLPAVSSSPGFSDLNLMKEIQTNAYSNCGAKWFSLPKENSVFKDVNCKNAVEVYTQLKNRATPLRIHLTSSAYSFDKPLLIDQRVEFTSSNKNNIQLSTTESLPSLFIIRNKGNLSLADLRLSAEAVKANSFISSDTAGSSEHFNLAVRRASVQNLSACKAILYVCKSTIADSIVIENSDFSSPQNGFVLADEKDNKGYYNVEKMRVVNNKFINGDGVFIDLYRGGNDESTLGPKLTISDNTISNYNTRDNEALLQLTGVQKTNIINNTITGSNEGKTLFMYKDTVRANHFLANNKLIHSGAINKNSFVTDQQNIIQ
jgi:poly(beta-D-mannuronate) lyase